MKIVVFLCRFLNAALVTVHTPQPSIRNPLRYLLMWVGALLLRRICKMLKLFESKLSEFWHLAYL